MQDFWIGIYVWIEISEFQEKKKKHEYILCFLNRAR